MKWNKVGILHKANSSIAVIIVTAFTYKWYMSFNILWMSKIKIESNVGSFNVNTKKN